MDQVTASLLYSEIAHYIQEPSADARRFLKKSMEKLFRQLVSDAGKSFTTLTANMAYVLPNTSLPAELHHALMTLRRLVVQHKGRRWDDACTGWGLKVMIETIAATTNVPVPELLSQSLSSISVTDYASEALPEQEAALPELRCCILEIGPLRENAEGHKYCFIKADTPEWGIIRVQLTDNQSGHLALLYPLLAPYQHLQVLHCIRTAAEHTWTTTPESQMVLEPDILMDISDLAECCQFRGDMPLLYLVKKLMPQQYNDAALKGNLVNALLDAVLRNSETPFKSCFREVVADNVLQASAYGKEILNNIYKDIAATHWPNLYRTATALQDRPVRIEPTFFSARYGLQGRLDVLAEDAADITRKDILELKSGRAPDYQTWRNNEMQVVGYNLLLQSAFGAQRCGGSSILYSAASTEPLRPVRNSVKLESELLSVRNQVVGFLMQIAAGNYTILGQITPVAAEGLPGFLAVNFAKFAEGWYKAPPLAKAYYQQFLSFLIREWLQAKCGMYSGMEREEDADGFAALWLQDEEDKRGAFSLISGLHFISLDPESGVLSFEITEKQSHNFRVGDTAILYARREGRLNPLLQQVLKGRIDAMADNRVFFSLNNRQLSEAFFTAEESWVLEHDMYESNYWVSAASLWYVLDPAYTNRLNCIMGLQQPAMQDLVVEQPAGFNLNQYSLLRYALEAQDYYLVQGPPGTGKTSTLLTALVRELLQRRQQVVVVAFTNRAVDEICKKLDDTGVKHLRLGSRKSASEQQLRQLCMDGKIEEARQYITGQQVFVATVATMAARLDLLEMLSIKPDTLVVDEASQLTEPQLLGLLMHFRKFVLIGDQNQLPPVVAQHEQYCKVQDATLLQAGITDLRVSVFERLMQQCREKGWYHAFGMLTTHFRMHDTIADLINPYYAGRLQSGRTVQQETFEQTIDTTGDWSDILGKGRRIFMPSPQEPVSKLNKEEARRVVALLQHLKQSMGAQFNPDVVGVVTPWRTQISYIRELIGDDAVLQAVNIDTVERFQGSENDIIIVSLAVNHPGQLRQLQSDGVFRDGDTNIAVDRKLLVTLSRARHQVVLMGYEPVLKASIHYSRVLSQMDYTAHITSAS